MDQLPAFLQTAVDFLSGHTVLTYFILFFGSYFDAIVGVNFIVRGEIFFLAGSILAGAGVLNIVLVSLVIFAGSIAGDNTSFFLGHHFGEKLFKEHRFVFNLRTYEKGKAFFDRFGAKAVLFARLLGPLTWITPFIAGMYRTPYREFIKYNILGVVIGVGQFLVVGYIFGVNYQNFLHLGQKYAAAAVIAIIIAILVYHFFMTHILEFAARIKAWLKR